MKPKYFSTIFIFLPLIDQIFLLFKLKSTPHIFFFFKYNTVVYLNSEKLSNFLNFINGTQSSIFHYQACFLFA